MNSASVDRNKKYALNAWTNVDWLWLLALITVGALLFLPALGSYGILDPSDGLYAEGAREMVEGGNYLLPQVNYAPFFEKPILIYWLIAASYKLFGISEFAARLPSALSAMATIASTYILLRKLTSRSIAAMSAAIMSSGVLFVVIGHVALTDMTLTFFMTTALLCLLLALENGGVTYLILAYSSLGLALLLKGPVAVALVGIVGFFYVGFLSRAGIHHNWWQLLFRIHPLAGTLWSLAIALPWYWQANKFSHGELFQEFFIRQNFGRLAGSVNHLNPWWYYIPIFIGGFFPWSIFLIFAPPLLKRAWRDRFSTETGRLQLFCTLWSCLILGCFTLIKTKLPTYILPAWPGVSIVIAIFFSKWMAVGKNYARSWISPIILTIFLLVLIASTKLFMTNQLIPRHWLITIGIEAVLYLVCLTLVAWLFQANRIRQAIWFLICSTAAANMLVVPGVLCAVDQSNHKGFRQLLKLASDQKANIALYQWDSPAASFYLHKAIPILMNGNDINHYLKNSSAPHMVLVTKKSINRFEEQAEHPHLVATHGKWLLFSI